jgi:hypothetical protein
MSFASPHTDVELPDLGLHAFLFAGLAPPTSTGSRWSPLNPGNR